MNERIRELRNALGITLEEFGGRLGVTRTAISRLERGNRSVTDQMAVAICREFGVNEQWLRTGEGEMFEQTRETVLDRLAAEYSLDKEQVSVIENFLDLSPQERTAFLACMRKVFGGPVQPPRRADVPDAEAQKIAESDEYKSLVEKKEQAEGKAFSTAG